MHRVASLLALGPATSRHRALGTVGVGATPHVAVSTVGLGHHVIPVLQGVLAAIVIGCALTTCATDTEGVGPMAHARAIQGMAAPLVAHALRRTD